MPCDKKLDILVFSILNIFDGTSGGLPAFALVPSPHPDDEADAKENDEDWWPTGVDIAEAPDHLHAMWATKTVQ
jgi:hypothetical protein